MRVLGMVALGVVLLARPCDASCQNIAQACFCGFNSQRVGVAATDSLDGGVATVRIESSEAGFVPDASVTFPAEPRETAGQRWLVIDQVRRPIDGLGSVGCPEYSTKSLPLETVVHAVLSPSCAQDLAELGFTQACDDTPGCAGTPAQMLPILVLALLLRRRARAVA